MILRRPPNDRPAMVFIVGAILTALALADAGVALAAWSVL